MIINTIEQCDYRDFIPTIPDNSIDLLLTDPPYNASGSGLSTEGGHKLINEAWDYGFDPSTFINLILPKLKDNGQMLIFCSYHLLGDYLNIFIERNPKIKPDKIEWKQILHWYKTNSMPSLTGKVYGFAIEYVLWYCNSKEYTFNKSQRASYLNVFEGQAGLFKVTEHPAEKPLSLFRQLVRTHSNEGNAVCDLFMGSGTTAVACVESNRNFIGCEIDPRWVEVAYNRIKEAGQQGDLL
jgi:DNA modification methylase